MINRAVILAGGLGTRLRPITYEIPKALIPVHGKPLTEHLIDLLKKHHVKNVTLAVGHMRDKIKAYFQNGEKLGIPVNYIEETEPVGTGGPLLLGKHLLTETFICSNGDELKKIDIQKMLALHKKNNALVTIALVKVEDPSQYGVARFEGERILEFVEKPKREDAPSNLISSGFYIMEPGVLSYITPGFCMLEKIVFPKLAAEGKLFGFVSDGQWFDTGTMERYEKAIKEWEDIC